MCDCKFTGKRTCHCSACHHTFASPNSFDWHQRMFSPYGLVCLNPEMVFRRDGSRVLFQDSKGYWREHRPDLEHVKTVMDRRSRAGAGEGAAA